MKIFIYFVLVPIIVVNLNSLAQINPGFVANYPFNESANNGNGNNFTNSLEPDSIVLSGEINGNRFGYSVSTAGDVNGDGFSDVIVGDYQYQGYKGRAYIFYGGLSVDTVADIIMTGESGNNRFGLSVASAGDLNGDGYSDVIVGAPNNDGANDIAGRAYIYFGGVEMDGVVDKTLYGQESYDNFGYSVSTAGDVNNDGYSDVIVGAFQYHNVQGYVFIYYGGASMDSVKDVTFLWIRFNQFGESVSTAEMLMEMDFQM
ncbi:MAG: FG-GAP repeat protein [Ignavibacteria bacterium]|nr:FG-GAP repeat protein [Ignavibacteria bacterium]